MDNIKWSVYVQWPDKTTTRHTVSSTEDLKDYLDRQAFCTRHGCPLPESVQIVIVQ